VVGLQLMCAADSLLRQMTCRACSSDHEGPCIDICTCASCHSCVWCVVCAGKWGYYALGAYGSLAMAIFMVKTMKRVIFQETRAYGKPSCWRVWRCLCRLANAGRPFSSEEGAPPLSETRWLSCCCISGFAPDCCHALLWLLIIVAVGTDIKVANYLLLALAAFQFPFSFLLAYRPM
jgi:hypothetical protein